MKKWSEIKQGIVTKLFMNPDEATDDYADTFVYYANECLVNIANGVKPRIAMFKPVVYANSMTGVNFKHEDGKYTMESPFGDVYEIVPNNHTIYIDVGQDSIKRYVIKNGEFEDVTNKHYYVVKEHIKLPDDFLSFSDMVNYVNGEPDPEIRYVTDNLIMLTVPGIYQIFYNALWANINEDSMLSDEELPIDQSVLNCIPPYVAAQIMSEDDVQKSTMLNNEYELMLSRLDTNIMYQSNSFKSTGGWY